MFGRRSRGELGDGVCGGLVGVEGIGMVQDDLVINQWGMVSILPSGDCLVVGVPWSRFGCSLSVCMFVNLKCSNDDIKIP